MGKTRLMKEVAERFTKKAQGYAEKWKKMGKQARAQKEAAYGKETYKKMWEQGQKDKIERFKGRIKKYRNIKAKDFKPARTTSRMTGKPYDVDDKRYIKNSKVRTAIRIIKKTRDRKYEEMYK